VSETEKKIPFRLDFVKVMCHTPRMKNLAYKIETPERLDQVVAKALQISRSKVQKAIKAKQILVNGKVETPHFKLQGTEILAFDPTSFDDKVMSIDKPLPLDIIYENDDVLVINKPANLLVHETESSTETTLVDSILAYNKKIAKVGNDPKRAGIVHRLDKDASGVMIVAKNNNAFDHLKRQFMERKTTKRYTVMVMGQMEKDHQTIMMPISRSKTHGRMAAKPASQGGKEAITHYDVVERFRHHSLLDVTIETGRTHQIRAHMFALAHPVVGDRLYRMKGIKPRPIGRIFLHARELTITLPNGEEKIFTAPLPEDLQLVLAEIPKS